MNEQKRRGRPPKAKLPYEADHITEAQAAGAVDTLSEASSEAQAYALRIWTGQSPDLSRHERLGRVAVALEAQGMSMEGVSLPDAPDKQKPDPEEEKRKKWLATPIAVDTKGVV